MRTAETTTETIKNRIADAALATPAGLAGGWVKLSVIRAALPDIDREDLDRALLELPPRKDAHGSRKPTGAARRPPTGPR